MKLVAKPDKGAPIPPTLDEIIAEIRKYLPESPEGAFCRGDVINALDISVAQADFLLESWREKGIARPAGKVNRTNAWGDSVRVAAYTFVEVLDGRCEN